MKRILIKNFGPIQDGFGADQGWISIPKVTVFIGDNGTGKSTVAKLISIFSWIEKGLFQGRLLTEDFLNGNISFKRLARYHKIESFVNNATDIRYEGVTCFLIYSGGHLSFIRKGENLYTTFRVPKIMYVGAERNFLSVAANPEKIKGLPESLGTFLDEFNDALSNLAGEIALPIEGVTLSYQEQSKTPYIHAKSKSYTLRLTEASSGIQSATPLFLVSRYLAKSLKEKPDNFTRQRSSEEEKAFKAKIAQIVENPRLNEEVKSTMLELLSAKTEIGMFQNIVEEPEQNLFPDSQRAMLNALLGFANSTPENELLITTHSPYLISYLSLAMKAAEIDIESLKAHEDGKELLAALERIVPLESTIKAELVAIYEVTREGKILLLPQPHGVPADDHYLNARLMEMNDLFAQLLEIEMEASAWQ